MKSAYIKDSKKMFKNNIGRFCSIVLIIMLGTSFFIGMNAISPQMKKTAEKYMKDEHIYDYIIESNLGYNNEDVKKFADYKNITEAHGIYSYDALAKFEQKDIVVRVSSLNSDIKMNETNIIDGRKIENENE